MSPRYTRPLAEKIMAVAGTYSALYGELHEVLDTTDAIVQAEMLRSAVTLALASDTKDVPLDFLIPGSPAKEAADRFEQGTDDQGTDREGQGDDD